MNEPTQIARDVNLTSGEDVVRTEERPNKRKLERIALYKAVIGHGHANILELGCGSGDLAYALVDHARKIVATDIDPDDIERARRRADLWSLSDDQLKKLEFRPMSALQLDFSANEFDWAISTSMVEYLEPREVERHLREVERVLKAGGSYLIWCPNGLGRHEDQAGHLTMLSYREWTEKLRNAGFQHFRSTMTSHPPLVDAGWKVFFETVLSRTGKDHVEPPRSEKHSPRRHEMDLFGGSAFVSNVPMS